MKNIKSTKVFFIVFLAVVTMIIAFFVVSINRNFFMKAGYKEGIPKIGAVIYKYDDTFMSYVRGNMEKDSFGKAALNIQDSQNNQSRQLEQIDGMIRDNVRVLTVNLVDPKSAKEVINKAKDAKLPVIFFNKEPEASVLESYNSAWYVGADSSEAGILQGKMIVKLWSKNKTYDKDNDGVLSYVLFKGEPDHPDTDARTKYAIEEIKKAGIKVKELDSYYGMWDKVKARDKMDEWIAKFGSDIEFVISNNDTMALGAITSLEKNGCMTNDKLIPVVGVDAIQEALEKIKEGKMMGTVMNDAKKQGTAVIDIAINAAEGKNITEGTSLVMSSDKSVRVPYITITKDNLNTVIQEG
ncbi:galactose/glucose ABC transporter substrate-binding protein MglB [Clostridium sp. SHJSY1]|uniref:galactose ABC transporter substrate-binding protein n=1 Tax=Clostridium sp. SHJSY1 TaxID=2942483 RepID=UPI002876E10B|nr:galactose ABC transporter substrate-binding protein [Clostridium sp. SHJSY1]MDS0524238.1 galactose/glucose ABC transporter substrate-binding protein MglB [Clostridium sp. SHJSY1]